MGIDNPCNNICVDTFMFYRYQKASGSNIV